MMEIISHEKDEYGQSIVLRDGKREVYVRFGKRNDIQVIFKNASHSVWRGAGRFFSSWTQAVEGYKLGSVKGMIRAAEAEFAPAPALKIFD